ncbi:MAG: peptidylprolyl isomerase [Bacteroidales bacterium]|jgi:cyclophilin family peptidyl-prolyl cis-trans isomerase|nr:peptidylprolyl isomerase [Bacteroidales bacterium]MDD3273553.1 peptidylprolyl isomerase [Bacteroidales bacterium]MDD4058444.1 peptidylprolyl isomerase [Bacteroidales bacterium]
MKKTIFNLMIIIALVATSCKGGKQGEDKEQIKQVDTTVMTTTLAFNAAELSEEPLFDIETSAGTIRIKLYKETPLHRDNFVKLASERFFDGILFHRVIKGFMIQVGDPLTKDPSASDRYGTGGPGYTIPAEILPQFNHKKGALAAARRADSVNPERESSGSQFYLVEDPSTCAQLDGQYTVFGETVSGMEVIDKIAATATGPRDRPVNDIKILSVKPVTE